jgi:hypothetical protein
MCPVREMLRNYWSIPEKTGCDQIGLDSHIPCGLERSSRIPVGLSVLPILTRHPALPCAAPLRLILRPSCWGLC